MFQAPRLVKFVAGRFHEAILDVLKARFGTVPPSVPQHLAEVLDERRLRKLNVLAAQCPDVQAFLEALLA